MSIKIGLPHHFLKLSTNSLLGWTIVNQEYPFDGHSGGL